MLKRFFTTFPISSLEKSYRMLVYPDRYEFTVPLQYMKLDTKDIEKVFVKNDSIIIIVSKIKNITGSLKN